jgi:hypothetical protein
MTMNIGKIQWLGVVLAFMGLSACATVSQDVANSQGNIVADTSGPSERDRQTILAMAGDFKVTFDFRETVSFQESYELKDAYVTHAEEIVRVIEDRGDFISLQHTLIVGRDKKMSIKHWRQDWVFEPETITQFIGANAWSVVTLGADQRRGRWAQLVYQVDDGPRYAGLGNWSYDNGFPEWVSDPTLRPLPRRDATKRSDYHALQVVNRHALTPNGWVHEQDNTKLILDGSSPQALVREVGINTYVRTNEIQTTVADDYWNKTADFWSAVRSEWTRLETETPGFGLTVQGEPEEVYMSILGAAAGIVDGDLTQAEAIAQAMETIREYTETDLAPLQVRLATPTDKSKSR